MLPYSSEHDYQRTRTLVADNYAPAGLPVYRTLDELDWWQFSDAPRFATRARLWFNSATIQRGTDERCERTSKRCEPAAMTREAPAAVWKALHR
jgi:hypothetical protein